MTTSATNPPHDPLTNRHPAVVEDAPSPLLYGLQRGVDAVEQVGRSRPSQEDSVADASSLPVPRRPSELALVELAKIPADASLDDVFARACEVSADALEVERVGIWLFIDDQTVLRCAHLFERSKREHSTGALLRVADFPKYFSALRIRKSLPAAIAVEEPWTSELTSEYLAPLGITSMLDAGIFVDGEMVGVVCHEHVGPSRQWSTEARDFVGSVADVVALRIQSAEVRELRSAFRRQQKRLVAQAKLSAMEELTAGIAHDFKNLLTVFRVYGKLLSERTDLPADARDQAAEILTATERGTSLARELMEFARPSCAPPSVIDLAEVVREQIPMLEAAIGPDHTLDVSTGSDSYGRVLMERTQLARMLLNIVVNAREAMPSGGTIVIRVAPVQLKRNGGNRGRYILLEVADQGVGMDEETRSRVLEPYFTTKPKGTGLGLPSVQQIVDRVGGVLRIESHVGVGTIVRAYFPAIRASDAAEERKDREQSKPPR
jgi:two-component system cell cycle sensor histidine kinase/response regulator CckA